MGKKIAIGLIIALLFPYIVTLAWTGTIEGKEKMTEILDGGRILLDREQSGAFVGVEEYLIGVVAKQMPADYGREALRAQAIVARTYIRKQMGREQEIAESALDLDYMEEKQMESLWGAEHAAQYYQNIEEAVKSTAGMVITYDGELITPLFHRASTGKTRAGDEGYPYLQPAESPRDVEAENFLQIYNFSREDFADRVSQIPDAKPITADQIPESIQVLEKDNSGYILKIQIGSGIYTGEEVQYALGLASSCFAFEGYGDGVRAVCRGIGHGYGLSQYGAKVKAGEGMTAEEILAYFYKNIVLISE